MLLIFVLTWMQNFNIWSIFFYLFSANTTFHIGSTNSHSETRTEESFNLLKETKKSPKKVKTEILFLLRFGWRLSSESKTYQLRFRQKFLSFKRMSCSLKLIWKEALWVWVLWLLAHYVKRLVRIKERFPFVFWLFLLYSLINCLYSDFIN